jgi:hypothetical protein
MNRNTKIFLHLIGKTRSTGTLFTTVLLVSTNRVLAVFLDSSRQQYWSETVDDFSHVWINIAIIQGFNPKICISSEIIVYLLIFLCTWMNKIGLLIFKLLHFDHFRQFWLRPATSQQDKTRVKVPLDNKTKNCSDCRVVIVVPWATSSSL